METTKAGYVRSQIKRKPTESGESLEEMIRRCTESNEPIEAKAPMIYTDEADGVQPQYDIRADRTDIALDAIDKYQKSEIARKQEAEKPEQPSAQEKPDKTE